MGEAYLTNYSGIPLKYEIPFDVPQTSVSGSNNWKSVLIANIKSYMTAPLQVSVVITQGSALSGSDGSLFQALYLSFSGVTAKTFKSYDGNGNVSLSTVGTYTFYDFNNISSTVSSSYNANGDVYFYMHYFTLYRQIGKVVVTVL